MKTLKNKWVVIGALVVLFAVTRLSLLTKLPVFADEAIYIRWSQVGQNEPDRYLFLSMLDGKPPLHNWLITPFRAVFADPLLASRLLSVVAGGMTCLYLFALTKTVTKSNTYSYYAVLFSIMLPMFVINERMGLAESLLTLFFVASIYHGFWVLDARTGKSVAGHTLLFGLSWGLALYTKTNALFFALPFTLLPFLYKQVKSSFPVARLIQLFLGGVLSMMLFLTLKQTPLFPFLFSRSQNYAFTIPEIINGQWKHVLFNSLPKIGVWIAWYMGPLLLVVPFFEKKLNKIMLLMVLSYMAPLVIVGKIVYPRYFMPVAPLLVLMIIFGLRSMQGNSTFKKISKVLTSISLAWASVFVAVHIISPNNTWYVSADRQQYLEEWSSGHGIPEVRDFIRERLKETEVVVATEGFFGTLPDGLMMYFDGTPEIANLELYGIGQPISHMPSDLYEKAKTKEVYVVVNAHRFMMPLTPQIQKVGEFPRPNNGPALLLLKINAT